MRVMLSTTDRPTSYRVSISAFYIYLLSKTWLGTRLEEMYIFTIEMVITGSEHTLGTIMSLRRPSSRVVSTGFLSAMDLLTTKVTVLKIREPEY